MSDKALNLVEQARLDACSQEPIRTPGSIQAHGAFLGIDRESRVILVVSANCEKFIGSPPSEVLGRVTEDFIGEDRFPALREAAAGANPAYLTLGGHAYDAIVHRDGPVTFVELEPQLPINDRDSAAAAYAAAQRLSNISDNSELVAAVAEEFRALTGFDRVMVYHFHKDGHGEVVADARADDMEPYLGLHFPASDIPKQARDLYLTKLSRAIVSTTEPDVPLLSLSLAEPVQMDLSLAELRSVSPFHLQFMRNMGQASTVSFSLVHRGHLIGMITCAHRVEHRLPFLVRRRLEVLANQVALQLGAIDEILSLRRTVRAQELRARLLANILSSGELARPMLTGRFTVLDVIPADAASVSIDGETGHTPGAPDAAALEQIRALLPDRDAPFESNSLPSAYPQIAALLPGFTGMLVVPLPNDGDVIAFFRREVVQTVNWLGDLSAQNREESLSPRLSFSAWSQSVTGKSLPWGDLGAEALDLAAELDSARLRRAESRLATLAMHDPLSGLANRRSLMADLATAMDRTEQLSLLFVDIDQFKAINDTFGHDAGDTVIVEIGRRLTECTRGTDLVARLGGDEFVVLCEDLSEQDAHALAQRIASSVRVPIALRDEVTTVTASIGIVTTASGSEPAELLERADAAMYRAKQDGRDRVSL